MIKAIGFDIGHTLINYRNPLNWRALYRPTLEQAARGCGIALSEEMAEAAPYPETMDTLSALRQAEIKIGVLTDVAYGMHNRFSLQDIAALSDLIDIALTSVDVGYRKPNGDIIGANRLGITSILINRTETALDYGQTHTVKSLRGILETIL